MKLDGQHVVVVGMGISGAAAVALLLARGARVSAVDSKASGSVHGVPIQPQTDSVFVAADLVVVSPGVPADADVLNNVRARGIKVIGEVELAGYYLQGPVIGITGSNGKTTTTALTGHILRESGIPCQVGGNIGLPLTAMVDSSKPNQWNVLELSSFQLETTETFHVKIGVAMNVTDNHLDRHYTFANYAAAKARLFANQTEDDFAILNADNLTTTGYARQTRAQSLWFSAQDIRNGVIFLDGQPLMKTADVPLKGSHNYQNVIAAALAARITGTNPTQIAAAVRTFPGVEHRLEYVRTVNGVAYYNDSKATSVDAALKAIDAFESGLWVILGGKDKNSDYTPLQQPLRQKAKAALLIGSAIPKIEPKLGEFVFTNSLHTLQAAVAYAAAHAQPGDTVLLAPACASFDQFKSFEHRGETFKALVNQLAAGI